MTGLVYLDVETTGLDPARHEIWEMAWAVEDGPILSQFVVHRPITLHAEEIEACRVNRYIDRGAYPYATSAWHGAASGWPADACSEESEQHESYLMEALAGATMVGANPSFDATMLRARWGHSPWRYRLLDIEAYAAGAFGLDYVPSLSEVCERLDIAPGDHTAAGDVRAVRDAYQALRLVVES